jgi:hypothetical protein
VAAAVFLLCAQLTASTTAAASGLSSNTLTYDCGSFSDNSNGSWFTCDPSGASFSNALDHADATTTSDDHIFDPGGVPSHSDLPPSRVLHSIVNHH